MVSMDIQMLLFVPSIIGFLGTIIVCAMPIWKVTSFIGSNIVTQQVFWEGLWMNCVTQSTGQMKCKIYDSLLDASHNLQATRAMVVIAIIGAAFGIILGVGGKYANLDPTTKARLTNAAGVIFICAGILVFVPVSWTANTIIRSWYNPDKASGQRTDLGAALYVGWSTAALLILGGDLLCVSRPSKESQKYPISNI